MSRIYEKKVKSGFKFSIEQFDSAQEVVTVNQTREIMSSRFDDMRKERIREGWHGVDSYDEALKLMQYGYEPVVQELKGAIKSIKAVQEKRFGFQNSVMGFAPVVPLALMGVPNSMIDMQMKQIKTKVIDVYYDMTNSCGHRPEDFIEAGKKALSMILKLEQQGYRFNLYAIQTYSVSRDADMIVVKIKSANQPMDIKRMSFPLTHPAFFRVIGFDWYSRFPKGTYRSGYGRALNYSVGNGEADAMMKELFGSNAIYLYGTRILGASDNELMEVLTNENKKSA